ncbi:MAG: glycoside hydrolase family 18 protein [Clostridia bacterium]|nr:glycoside hydrolase family 18 protein [Clostridia bacterium]
MAVFIERVTAFFTSLILVIANFFGITDVSVTKKVDNFKVTTYVRGDYIQDEGSFYTEDFDIVTDVILFELASFNSEGKIIYDEAKLERALSNLRKAIGSRDVNITLNLLGPWGVTDSDVWEEQMEAQSDEHNKAFTSGVLEDNIIAMLDKYDFDGVHFDYEYPLSNNAWKHYNAFLVSLDKKLGDEYTLGVAGNYWNIKFNTAAVAAIDTFEIMLYDMVDAQGRHATYEDTVKAAATVGIYGMPLDKVNIGLPFYSRPTDMSTYWYGYNGCYEGIDENGWYHCDDINKDFWFNTPDVIESKTQYAIDNGFGGVMIWHYNCDLPSSHEDSLLRAIGTAVNDNY